MSGANRAAWDEYWHGASAERTGCLPSGLKAIDAAQDRVWRTFAATLPRRARVLDLASGDGAVMRRLIAARPDLNLTGVDAATTLPPAPKGTKLRGGIAMERLPFPTGTFGAVTSQFGFEYGELEVAAAECVRVLMPGGRLAILAHRPDGSILAHNRPRRDALQWVLDERRLIDMAVASLKLRSVGSLVPPVIAAAPSEGLERFGLRSAAWELAEAVVRTLRGGAGHPPAHVAATLGELRMRADNEVARIDALERACTAAGDGSPIAAALNGAGLNGVAVKPVCEAGDGSGFAHFVTARR